MNDYRAISDAACATATSDAMPTMGALTIQTLDMQEETLAVICNIVNIMWGDECTAPPAKPNESILARLVAIQENQRAILTAVKAISDKL